MKTQDEIEKQTPEINNLIRKLFQEYNSLQSFYDAIRWDRQAQEGIIVLQKFQHKLNSFLQELVTVFEKQKEERSQSAFFQKVFSSRSNEKETQENIKTIEAEIQSVSVFIEKLTEMIDKTPDNKSEQKQMAGELRQLKKDLALQKRELNESLRQTRATARQKTALTTGLKGSGFVGSVARYNRLAARLEKESSLVPLEGQKALIEKELISIDKDLNWVLHFRDDGVNAPDETPQTNVSQIVINQVRAQSCPYCGREVTRDVCSSCGAIIPVIKTEE